MYRFRVKYTATLKYFSSAQTIRSFNDQKRKIFEFFESQEKGNTKS